MIRSWSAATADCVTIALAGAMAVAAAMGLGLPALYRDNLLVAAGWRGNDLVTLVVAVPALVASRLAARRGSAPAQLVWLGLADYAFYNYLFYLFGSAFNAAFLLYVAVVAVATLALVGGLVDAHVNRLGERLAARRSRGLAIFLFVLALGLGGVHIGTALAFVVSGEVPAVVTAVAHPTNVIAALDLWLVASWCLLAGWWVWRGRPWGFLLAAVVSVKGAFYMTALSAATVAAARAGAAVDLTQLVVWAAIGAACLVAALRLLAVARR